MINIKKYSYSVQMSYDVSDKEKLYAQKAIYLFDAVLKSLRKANDHLDLMYTPFKNNPQSSPEDNFKQRSELRLYRDKMLGNFDEFKKLAFKCVVALRPFDSDTQTIKLKKSFVLCVNDIEKQVNRFAELFDDLKSNNFSQTMVKSIDLIKKEISQLEQIIEDRVKAHIQNNILARTWVDNVGDQLEQKVEKKSPLVMDLVNERNQMVEDLLNKRFK